MINFPILNSTRSPAENNRSRKSGSVKASKETAEVAAEKPVTTTERRRDPSHQGHNERDMHHSSGSEKNKARHIDITI